MAAGRCKILDFSLQRVLTAEVSLYTSAPPPVVGGLPFPVPTLGEREPLVTRLKLVFFFVRGSFGDAFRSSHLCFAQIDTLLISTHPKFSGLVRALNEAVGLTWQSSKWKHTHAKQAIREEAASVCEI